MSSTVYEIAEFRTGQDQSIQPYLAPSDAFINVYDGFVHRGVLQSRLGYRQWATGGIGDADVCLSRLAVDVSAEALGNSANAAEQSFTLANGLVSRESVTIDVTDSVLGAKKIVITPGDADGAEVFSGDVNAGGTNTIDWITGDIVVTFDATLTGGDAMTADYRYFNDDPVMGIFEWINTSNTKKLIAFDTDYGYTYDTSQNRFEKIPFNAGAGITAFTGNNAAFFSGTTYPFKDNTDRFVFTNNTNVLFRYNGTDLYEFSTSADYVAPAAGALNKVFKVHYYGGRLVCLRPTIGTTLEPQMALWTGIRDSGGAGDDFAGTGSGFERASTSQWIMDSVQTQNDLFVFFQRSIWKLEITTDVFSPFRWVHVTDLEGIDATFSAVNYLGTNEAIGKTGILGTDGRNASRIDNKIPYFTRDEIDHQLFDYIYSGYNRGDSQFWFTFPLAEENAGVSNKILAQNYEEITWSVYDIPMSVLGRTTVGQEFAWNQISEAINEDWARWDETTDRWNQIGVEAEEEKLLGGDHRGFIYIMNRGITDKPCVIRGASKASECVLTLNYHNFLVGDTVVVSDVEGMTELNSDLDNLETYYTVTDIGSSGSEDQVTISVDSTDFTTYTQGGLISKVIEFSAETVELNPIRKDGMRLAVEIYRFLLTSGDTAVNVDLYDDSYSFPYKSDISIATDVSEQDKVWKIVSANANAYFHRLKFKQNLVKDQCKINILQIKASPGGEIG